MKPSGRRGDSDDDGAAPPVNRRYVPTSMSVSSGGSQGRSRRRFPSALPSLTARHQSAPVPTSTATCTSNSEYDVDNTTTTTFSKNVGLDGPVAAAAVSLEGSGTPSSNTCQAYRSASLLVEGTPSSTTQPLPNRWVINAQDRVLSKATKRTHPAWQFSWPNRGDPMHIHMQGTEAAKCLLLANHPIPVDRLKEVALQTPELQVGSSFGVLLDSGDPLSNLRSKPFGGSGGGGGATPRISRASLYPSICLDNHSMRNLNDNNNNSSSSSHGTSSGPNSPKRSNNNSRSISPKGRPGSTRKTTSSPVFYFEVTIQALKDGDTAVVSVGLVVSSIGSSGENDNDDDTNSPVVPGELTHSIGLNSKGRLYVSGRLLEERKLTTDGFGEGDVIGCGLEVLGTRRVFFTKNGKTVIPPTRFQDVDPKLHLYTPSVGVVAAAATNVAVLGNFGTEYCKDFAWEESELSQIVNHSITHQLQSQSQTNYEAESNKPLQGMSSPEELASPQSNLPPLASEEPPTTYNFGRPSNKSGGLMDSSENIERRHTTLGMPKSIFESNDSLLDENDNDYPGVGSYDFPGAPDPSRRVPAGWTQSQLQMDPQSSQAIRKPPQPFSPQTTEPSANCGESQSPSRRRQKDAPDETKLDDAGSNSSSKSPVPRKGMFTFGRTKSKDQPEKANSLSPQQNTSKENRSKSTFHVSGPRMKKTGDQNGDGVCQDPSEIQNSCIDPLTLSTKDHLHPTAPPTVSARTEAASMLQQAATFLGKMSKNNGLDDDDDNTDSPDDRQVQVGEAAMSDPTISPPPSSQMRSIGCTKSQKSGIDCDNPDDVNLKTAVSSTLPSANTPIQPLIRGTTSPDSSVSADNLLAPSTAAAATPFFFGKKSKKSSLDDDNPDDVHLQSAISTSLTPTSSTAAAAAATPKSPTSGHAILFGTKSKKSGLDDEDQMNLSRQGLVAQSVGEAVGLAAGETTAVYGRKSNLKSSLEDDDDDDDDAAAAASQMAMKIGKICKKSNLDGDNPDEVYLQNAFAVGLNEAVASAGIAGEGVARLPHSGHAHANTSRMHGNSKVGTSGVSSNLFGTKSKKSSLEDDDLDDEKLQTSFAGLGGTSLTQLYGSRSRKSSLEDDEPDDFRYQNTRVNHNPQSHVLSSKGASSPQAQNGYASQPSATAQQIDMLAAHLVFNESAMEPSSGMANPSHSRARLPAESTEEDLLNKAIEESKRDQKKEQLKGQIKSSGPLTDPEEIEGVKENTRTLRSLCDDETAVEASVLEGLLEVCRTDQSKVQASLESDDPQVDFGVLLTLNELVLDAIKLGEQMLEGSKKRAPTTSSRSNLNLDIGALVEKKDVFSLICILRAQSDQRLDAALALMDFAKAADNLCEPGQRSLRDEIRSSGGMHSLITVFRAKGAQYELRVVSALAVAYVLPSFVESTEVHPTVGLKIMECLRFLSTARSVAPSGRHISRGEMYKAASMGVTTFWINELTPMLSSAGSSKSEAERSDLFRKKSTKVRRKGRAGGQRHQTLELQELLEMTVSLIVQIEKIGESESPHISDPKHSDSLLLWRYTNVEQVCAVDVARPIAVREGLLPILVEWIRSKEPEKVRPAVSALRYLTSIQDKYMAGWIHSQMVNEGALAEVVKLADNYYVGQDVRLAVAQILASLCVAPHTRAAVVDAKCISYLIGFLYDHSDKASQDVALFAGSAILQLAEGAITRDSVFGGGDTPDKSDALVDDIVNSGAIGSFIEIARGHEGKLRSMAIEAIRVLSEDTNPNRRTRYQLCEEGAARAIGSTLMDDVKILRNTLKPKRGKTLGSILSEESKRDIVFSVEELHDALCALANILEPIQAGKSAKPHLQLVQSDSSPSETLIQGCMETAASGGLDSLLWISSLPLFVPSHSDADEFAIQRIDLLEEACRSLASLSPLLLSEEPAAAGYSKCAGSVFEAFDRILKLAPLGDESAEEGGDEEQLEERESLLELNISALRGLCDLATAEPLKIRMVDKTLPALLQLRNVRSNRSEVANSAGQVLLSLGFEEDELAVQVAGSNPILLADWFCLQRSLVIQAMARAEIRKMVLNIWKIPFNETNKQCVTRLLRETTLKKSCGDMVSVDSFAENFSDIDLFENFADDDFSERLRESMVRQYRNFYDKSFPLQQIFDDEVIDSDVDEANLLSKHVYPLNETQSEIDWILSHDRSLKSQPSADRLCTSVSAPEHVDMLLNCCFPSKLLRNHVLPIFNLRPEASFNFRALTMPQRRYFSFRREGQLISRLCDRQAEALDFDEVHWNLGFLNSSFAGEFSETLVPALYLCPTIRGLSFVRDKIGLRFNDFEGDEYGEEGSAFLANLVGSLPPWIHSLTFQNIFNDRDIRTLVSIIEKLGKLSSDQAIKATSFGGDFSLRIRDSSAQAQGKFWSLAVSSSPQVGKKAWLLFFSLLGKTNSISVRAATCPLSSLKVLDLSFNDLGDETCATLLGIVHDPNSGCTLEQLDLSGNRIQKGTRFVNVLRGYVEYYRYSQANSSSERKTWQCSLHTLRLSSNQLGSGPGGIELVALLKHNALALSVLDLSNNGFGEGSNEYEFSQVLVSSIANNKVLGHLNLSQNRFSAHILDDLLEQLTDADTESRVSFLGFDNNTPPLSDPQKQILEVFLKKSRRLALQKYLNEREKARNGEFDDSEFSADRESHGESVGLYIKASDLSIIGETTISSHQESGFKQDYTEQQAGDNMITVLFSAPLVFTDERRQLKPFAKLDFDMERELLWQCMKEASRDIELSFDNATHDRLLAAMTKRCSCLHYSGHGHPSYLPFEDGGGGPNWFKVEDIKRLIARDSAAPFKFVFVSACHSGLAGETFASAGVPHVVCCQQEFELKDTAALAFTRQFYLSLAIGHTIKESFNQGCKAVRATPNLRDSETEMKKFLLLPKDGNHDVPIFNARPVAEWPKPSTLRNRSRRGKLSISRIRNLHAGGAKSSELGVRNMMQEDPSPTPPQFFLGREVEMYYVLKATLCKRLVSVVSEAGLGRSSLCCALCHYINERASTIIAIERIYFIKAKRSRRVDGCRALMEQLLKKLVESGKDDPPDPDVDMEDIFDYICKALKNEKALVVFDRMEYLDNSDDAEEFPMLLSALFRGTKNVKVIVTGRRPLGIPSLGGQVEYPFPLGPLSFANTLRLFANLCPHLHTAGERHKLFERLATDGEQSELRPVDKGVNERTKAIFKIVGDGIPSRIEQAAYDISSDSLRDLLQQYGQQ